jgi:transposase
MNVVPSTPATGASTDLPLGEYACYIGLDWGDQKHVIALRAREGLGVECSELASKPETVHQWLELLQNRFGGRPVALAVEASKGAIIDILLEYPWLTIYPVHPATSRRFSMAFSPSGAANDEPDAKNLLEILCCHRHRLRALIPTDAETRRLTSLVQIRRNIVDQLTYLSNQLTSLLKSYFPQAHDLFGEDRLSGLALDFLERWPDLQALKKAKAETLRSFYYKHHMRRPELLKQRLELIRNARPLSHDPVLREVSVLNLTRILAQVRVLQKHLGMVEEKINERFASHSDALIFKSFPGAGACMAPRLCTLFGKDRERWVNAAELQKYYGIAPVIEASGKQCWVHWRWHAPTFHRQTLVEWAGISVRDCSWAKTFYEQQRQRGKGRNAILRALAFKWLRILFRCWKQNIPYNDAAYMQALKDKHSPLALPLENTSPRKSKKNIA